MKRMKAGGRLFVYETDQSKSDTGNGKKIISGTSSGKVESLKSFVCIVADVRIGSLGSIRFPGILNCILFHCERKVFFFCD